MSLLTHAGRDSQVLMVQLLLAVIAVLAGVATGLAAAIVSRVDGASVPASVRSGGAAFCTTVLLVMGVIAFATSLPAGG